MRRSRAYSDPASPSKGPASSRLPDPSYAPSFFHDSTSSQYELPRVPLSQGALAAFTAESSQFDRPAFGFTQSYAGINPYADYGRGTRRGRAPSVTPSTTSVSDDDDDKFDMALEEVDTSLSVADQSMMPAWSGSKGKGREMDVDGEPGQAGSLPAEILSQIFRSLSDPRDLLSVILTSRSWCLSAFQYLWVRPSFVSAHQLAMFVQVLNSPRLTLPYASQVRRINLQSIAADLTDNLIVGLEECHRVERLTLSKATQLSSFALQRVVDGMPDLVAIDLAEVSGTDDMVLKKIAERCSRIQGVNISGCKSVGDQGLLAMANKSKLLRRLKLIGCHRVTDASLTKIARKCSLLLEMDLGSVPQLSDSTVYGIFLNAVHLRELRLNQNSILTDRAFPNLPELVGASDEELENAAGQYANVVCRPLPAEITDAIPGYLPSRSPGRLQAAPLNLALLRPRTETFEHLRQVDLTGCNLLTDKAVQNLIANAPKLRNLTLAKCSALTDAAVNSIVKLGKHLHYLHLGHVAQITDAAVTKLARSCTRIRYIDLACCPLLTDLSVFELATNLPRLRRIGLVKVTKITDEGIHALTERHSSLERLHLSYCVDVSVAAVSYLLNRLLKLTHLSLTGIPAFKTPELKQFCRPAPPEFDERQRASFCVYSGPGIPLLRAYLNAQMAANTAPGSDEASTRRGSGSSASSVTVPGAGSPSSMEPRVRTHAPGHMYHRGVGRGDLGTVSHARRVSTPTYQQVSPRQPFAPSQPSIPVLSSAFATSTPNFLRAAIESRASRGVSGPQREFRASSVGSVNLDEVHDSQGGSSSRPSGSQPIPIAGSSYVEDQNMDGTYGSASSVEASIPGAFRHRPAHSTGGIFIHPPPIYGPTGSRNAAGGRARAMTGGQVPSPSTAHGGTVGGVAMGRSRGESFSSSPLRWMADMVGWGGGEEEEPRQGL